MRLLIMTAALLIVAATASGEVEKRLVFNSPNKRWQLTADWVPDHLGYVFDLHDRSNKKTYFKQTTVAGNEALPYRFSATWSPSGRYVAINVYYGRITASVLVIDVSGKRPDMRPLFPPSLSDFDDFVIAAGRWRNETDLEVEAHLPLTEPRRAGRDTSFSLLVRFTDRGSTIIKKTGSHE